MNGDYAYAMSQFTEAIDFAVTVAQGRYLTNKEIADELRRLAQNIEDEEE